MRVTQVELRDLLADNVLELRFFRRRDKPGWNAARRMLATNDPFILDTAPGSIALNFKKPTNPPAYDYHYKGLVCAWDLLWQDYRMIPAESVNVITVIPTEPQLYFWNYFNQYLRAMSPQDKVSFMNRGL